MPDENIAITLSAQTNRAGNQRITQVFESMGNLQNAALLEYYQQRRAAQTPEETQQNQAQLVDRMLADLGCPTIQTKPLDRRIPEALLREVNAGHRRTRPNREFDTLELPGPTEELIPPGPDHPGFVLVAGLPTIRLRYNGHLLRYNGHLLRYNGHLKSAGQREPISLQIFRNNRALRVTLLYPKTR